MLLAVVLCLSLLAVGRTATLNRKEQFRRMSNSWAVEIDGGEDRANEIAAKYGLVNLGQIGSLKNKFTFIRLNSDNVYIGSSPIQSFSTVESETGSFTSDPEVKFSVHQEMRSIIKRYYPLKSSDDPIWRHQWNVNNTGQTTQEGLYLDINVIGAWIQGYTGNGVIVGVVDDGVDSNHDDLRNNYNSADSYDYYDYDDNANPESSSDYHGTACAGEISMIRSNDKCGVGAAYDSQIASIRLLGNGLVVDSQEAGSLSHNWNTIQIYSNSWGPPDDGYTVMGPGPLAMEAFSRGTNQGRNGYGSVYTWAAGNGGESYDSCSADGYVQSIYTIPVGAYNQYGGPAYYDEMCSAKMTVAYVDNTILLDPDLQVATLLTNDDCTLKFGGTSAATPYVSAIIALALDANPNLTWRDVQYLIVYTSNPEPLLANTNNYFVNGGGLTVSDSFGFGAIDGEAMVTRAQRWVNVPEQLSHTIVPSTASGTTSYNNPFVSTFTYSGSIQYLEHITITLTLNVTDFSSSIDEFQADEIVNQYKKDNPYFYDEDAFSSYIKRGDFVVSLSSPDDTESTILFRRPYDIVNTVGYYNWQLLSVLHWSEIPTGQWTITVMWVNPNGGSGIVTDVSATLYGVSEVPESVANIPQTCSSTCARGCSGPSSIDCDVCNSAMIRNATTLECIVSSACAEPYQLTDGYCYIPSSSGAISGSVVFLMICYMMYFLF